MIDYIDCHSVICPVRVTERVIFDCDNTMGLRHKEIDDGLTLLYLLGRRDIALLGVTTTFGNGTIDEVYLQTKRLLRDLGRDDIPVFKGAGARGADRTSAARFLAETAAAHSGEVTVLATGPLGNLRSAAEIDPAFFSNLKRVVAMGGYLKPLQIGWRSLPELNLSSDPEAAWAVLNSGAPVTLMNAHICLQASFGWPDLWLIRHWGVPMRRIVVRWLLVWAYYFGHLKFYLWDLLPAVFITHPELFDRSCEWLRSDVGHLESGSLVMGAEGEGVPIHLPKRIVDVQRFREVLFEVWRSVSFGHPCGVPVDSSGTS